MPSTRRAGPARPSRAVVTGGAGFLGSHLCEGPRVRRPDITLAARGLGWTPVVPVEEGLRSTIDWFRSQLAGAPDDHEDDQGGRRG